MGQASSHDLHERYGKAVDLSAAFVQLLEELHADLSEAIRAVAEGSAPRDETVWMDEALAQVADAIAGLHSLTGPDRGEAAPL